MGRRSSSGFARAPVRTGRRQTGWELGPGGDDLATLDEVDVSASSVSILGSGVAPTVDGLTIVRVRGMIEVTSQVLTAIGDGVNFAFGIGVVTAAAFAIGVTAVPTPFTEASWEGWLWHQFVGVHGSPTIRTISNPINIEIDSKAMRKIGSDEVLMLAMEAGTIGTVTVSVRAVTRVLFKLQ